MQQNTTPEQTPTGPKLVIILPFLLHGMDGEELLLKIEHKISKLRDASFSTLNSNKIRKAQKETIKAKLKKEDLSFKELFSAEGIEVYRETQMKMFTEEFTRIRGLNSKVHFFFFQKHMNPRTYMKALPQMIEANGGDDTFDLIAITNQVCDIDESYEFKGFRKSSYLCYSKNDVFACLKKVLDVDEVPEHCDNGFDDATKVEVSCRIMKGLMDERLTPYNMRAKGFRITLAFQFVRNKVQNLDSRLDEYLMWILRNVNSKKPKYQEKCKKNIENLIRIMKKKECTYEKLDIDSAEVEKEVDSIVKSLVQVYGIEEVYEDFDVVENERVVTKVEAPPVQVTQHEPTPESTPEEPEAEEKDVPNPCLMDPKITEPVPEAEDEEPEGVEENEEAGSDNELEDEDLDEFLLI